jgi:PKHD-type hydroxylase
MSFKSITNYPDERARITHGSVWWEGAFNEEQLTEIEEYVSTLPLEDAKTIVGDEPSIRKSKRNFIRKNEDTAWIFETFNAVIERINDQFYGFDLNGYEYIQFGLYDSSNNGKYDFHMDMILDDGRPDDIYLVRKLSLTMLLNEPGVDFEGGEFEINRGCESESRAVDLKRGRIVAFPSFMIHRVKPVTKGVRKSLVIWVMGPKFK